MKAFRTPGTAFLAGLLVATTSHGETSQTASLLEALSLVSGGMLVPQASAPEVTHSGSQFHVHILLPKLTQPPNAAVKVSATLLQSGVWDITDVSFPSSGTLITPGTPSSPPTSLRFTIGHQAAHARVDPTLALASPYAVAFSNLALHATGVAPPADLTIEQIAFEGIISGDADKRVTTRSRSRTENTLLSALSNTGVPFTVSLKSLNGSYDVNGLDRAQAGRLREAAKAVAGTRQAIPPIPGQPPSMPPAMHEQLNAMIDASVGLLNSFDAEETLQGMHIETVRGGGEISDGRLAIAADTADGRLAGHIDVGLNGVSASILPAQYAPRRIALKTVFSGITIGSLRQLLRDATVAAPDPEALEAQAIALLTQAGAHVGIDTLQVEAGPLLLEGNAEVRPVADGSVGFDIHLTAHGLDAMLVQIQSDPQMQQIMPLLFLAKGIGKIEGDTIAWDISFAGGAVTINGIPMGQGGGARSPAKR